ncbi:Alpha/Beta hydrolase protein [Aspergillus caelatus]|uniref:Alpha/Beta hydrolase protein n=1 Tax=Aspergillus caelatus TaxID=61420 RepID=A0A5N7A7Y1_9EURO|nr:Alpha/Beta hydrolase protein [Aspergillus caelatus]KAE8365932.1 Alpha/Beta hydrolase protein [Aspergillus caelatus]
MLISSVSLLLASAGLSQALPHAGTKRADSDGLNWAPCNLDLPEGLEPASTVPVDCATLEVPLDYTNPDSKPLDLQLVKISASKEPVKGSIIFNPGGPGSSGIDELYLQGKGEVYRDLFGGHWNVVGFDARGTGHTIPFVCDVPHPGIKRSLSRRSNETLPQADMYSLLKRKAWNDAKVLVDACYEDQQETGRFLGTTFVARDMLKIVDALNEDGKLRFWGRSYSTILGQTFAAMFPDRIDRMLLDSVVLNDDYHAGHWITATKAAEDALYNFFTECINAGTTDCPVIANFTGPATTPDDLMKEMHKAFQELVDNPVTLPDDYEPLPWWQPGGMDLLTELKYTIFSLLYRPEQYPAVYTYILTALTRDYGIVINPPQAAAAAATIPPTWNQGANNFHGIACADSHFRANKPEDMYSLVQSQAVTGSFADAFSPQVWPCAQWKFKAAEQFEGPYHGINTSYPILFINSPYDPVTPLSNALEASARYLGSRVVVHGGHGHGFMNHPSSCSQNIVKEYFDEGKLPEVGTRCEPDMTGFEYAKLLLAAASGNSTVARRGLGSNQVKRSGQGMFGHQI